MEILKFYSNTCGPCKTLGTLLEKAEIQCTNIDVDDEVNDELVAKYGIRSIPTLVKVNDEGNIIDKHTGVMSVEQLKLWYKE